MNYWQPYNTISEKPLFPQFLKVAIFLLALNSIGCTKVFFQPSSQLFYVPMQNGFVVEDVEFNSADQTRLHAWYLQHASNEPLRGLIIQFHGNAENISTHFLSVAWLTKYGYDIFSFDYRGYGASAGKPSVKGAVQDGVAALQWAAKRADELQTKLIVYGQSLGGVIALASVAEVGQTLPVKTLIVESAFWKFKTIGREKLATTWISWPFQWLAYLLVSNHYASAESVRRLPAIPLLIIHGKKDLIVPYHHGEWIFKHASQPKCMLTVPEGGHINSMQVNKGENRSALVHYLENYSCDAFL